MEMSNTDEAPDPREAVLDAAAEEFAQRGFRGARVDSIARRAGVNKAMLYYRVGGKTDLYREVLLRAQGLLLQRLAAALVDDGRPKDTLRAYVHEFLDFAREHPEVPAMVMREAAGGFETMPEEALAGLRKILLLLEGILQEGRGRGVFVPAEPFAVQMVVAVAAVAASRGGPVLERLGVDGGEIPARLISMVLRGIERRPEDG